MGINKFAWEAWWRSCSLRRPSRSFREWRFQVLIGRLNGETFCFAIIFGHKSCISPLIACHIRCVPQLLSKLRQFFAQGSWIDTQLLAKFIVDFFLCRELICVRPSLPHLNIDTGVFRDALSKKLLHLDSQLINFKRCFPLTSQNPQTEGDAEDEQNRNCRSPLFHSAPEPHQI